MLYTDTVRATLLEEDTTRPFIVSSPSNGMIEQEPFVQRWGNVYVRRGNFVLCCAPHRLTRRRMNRLATRTTITMKQFALMSRRFRNRGTAMRSCAPWTCSETRCRFASEYGFQSFPSLLTLETVSEEEDWAPHSELMEHRQHHPHGTEQLDEQMKVRPALDTQRAGY